jgi:hypothetical protein
MSNGCSLASAAFVLSFLVVSAVLFPILLVTAFHLLILLILVLFVIAVIFPPGQSPLTLALALLLQNGALAPLLCARGGGAFTRGGEGAKRWSGTAAMPPALLIAAAISTRVASSAGWNMRGAHAPWFGA